MRSPNRKPVVAAALLTLTLAGVTGAHLTRQKVGAQREQTAAEASERSRTMVPPAQSVVELAARPQVAVPTPTIVSPHAAVQMPAPAAREPVQAVPPTAPLPASITPTRVTPPSGPPNPTSYRFSSVDTLGRPARWDPCTAIRWAFNPEVAPPGALELTHAAIGRLTSASGLEFSYAGTTAHRPLREPEGAMPEGIDAVIAFGTVGEYPDLSDGTFGIAGFTSSVEAEGSRIVSGGVVLNAPAVAGILDGFGRGQRRGGALMHELGHMVGLDHVPDPSQLMNPALTTSAPADYAEGDRTGLSKVGGSAGCFIVPASSKQLPPSPAVPEVPGPAAPSPSPAPAVPSPSVEW